jgi:hypothetical protein
MDKLSALVGNESGELLRSIPLREYLEHFPNYIHKASDWINTDTKSLLAAGDRDTNILASAQACFLPVPEDGGKVNFNVAIYNYQSSKDAPAILAIVTSVNGTSAQIITNDTGADRGRRYQRLHINMDGKCCPLVGQLLKEWRVSRGQTENLDAPITAEEKLHNAIIVLQVPLKRSAIAKGVVPFFGVNPEAAFLEEMAVYDSDGEVDECESASINPGPKRAYFGERGDTRAAKKLKSTTRDAIVFVGEATGQPFLELGNPPLRIERDPRFPIRATFQFYKTTSTGVADADDMAMIAGQFAELRKRTAVAQGSLVTGVGDKDRTTMTTTAGATVGAIPAWWQPFLVAHATLRGRFKETDDELAALVFRNGRFAGDQDATGLQQYLEQRSTAAAALAWGAF